MSITITIPQTSHSGTETFGPATVLAGFNAVSCTGSIPTADYEKAGNQFTFEIDVRPNSTAPWQHWTGFVWTSPGQQVTGRGGVIDPQPSCARKDLASFVGWDVRAQLVTPTSMTYGFTITLA